MEVMSDLTRKLPLDAATLRRLSVELSVHPRSLEKVFLGGVVRGLAGHRIRAGLAARNLIHLAPQLRAAPLGDAAESNGFGAASLAEAV